MTMAAVTMVPGAVTVRCNVPMAMTLWLTDAVGAGARIVMAVMGPGWSIARAAMFGAVAMGMTGVVIVGTLVEVALGGVWTVTMVWPAMAGCGTTAGAEAWGRNAGTGGRRMVITSASLARPRPSSPRLRGTPRGGRPMSDERRWLDMDMMSWIC